jgi:hypothetical protein
MLIEVDLSVCGAHPHEKEIVLGGGTGGDSGSGRSGRTAFLLPATMAAVEVGAGGAGGAKVRWERLLYSTEGLIPLAADAPDRGTSLNDLFCLLESYIRSLLTARDLLLDERLLSSDPEKGVYVRDLQIRSVWGAGPREEAPEKICRVAACLATKDRVLGAGAAMEQVRAVLANGTRGLGDCLKAAEVCHREWNYIV